MTAFDDIERSRETYIERTGYGPDLEEPPAEEGDGPTGDGRNGRYCVVAVYPDGKRTILSRWATSTMAAKIAGKVAEHGGRFSFIGVSDETDPERQWLMKEEPR